MNGQAIVQLLGALGVAGMATAILNAIFGRKKMSADVVKTINEAADSAVKRTDADNARLRKEREELDVRLEGLEREASEAKAQARAAERRADRLTDALLAYVSYAGRQTDVIRALGGVIDDPPGIPEGLLAH